MPLSSSGRLTWKLALALLLMAGLVACNRSAPGPEPVASYTFSQLTPNEPVGFQLTESTQAVLLVRVEGVETVFESSLLDAKGKALSVARLPYLRVGPVFHIIEYKREEVPITVTVQPTHLTRNSVIKVQVFVLPGETGQDSIRIDAYRDYARAIQSTEDESSGMWSARVEDLRSAAAGFARSDETEAQLWANYLAAYFTYFPLADYKSAVGQARVIQEQASQAKYAQIELMAMQMEGQILVERDENDSPDVAEKKQTRAQQVLQSAADLAGTIGMPFEQAWAINTRGIGYFYQDLYALAERQYQQALDISTEIEDLQLQQLVRGNLALVLERQGDLGGALGALHAVNQQLAETGSRSELAHNWSELSRLYQRLYLFPQSIDAQGRALRLWRDLDSAEGMGRSMASLAHAYLGMGNADMALSVMLEAIEYMEAANFGRGLKDGYELAAKIYRANGSFKLMSAARDQQEGYLTSDVHRARFQYERGLDSLARFPGDLNKASELFKSAEQLGLEAGDTGLQVRSWLQLCAVSPSPDEAPCVNPKMHQKLNDWLIGAPPIEELEARFLQARALVKLDRNFDALTLLNRLIGSFQFYRSTLPGVLGAWYWESRSQIFRMYMRLNLDLPPGAQRAERSLLALNQLLDTPASLNELAPPEALTELAADNNLRVLLARLEMADTGSDNEIRQEIDRELISVNARQRSNSPSLNLEQLGEILNAMPPDSILLAYYFSEEGAWVWTADSSGVQLARLRRYRDAATALDRARTGLRTIGNLDRDRDLRVLGEILLEPIEGSLPGNVYLLTIGELAGFPFEVIRRDGRFVGQDHEVTNLLSLNGLQQVLQVEKNTGDWQRILLAGDPQGEDVELPRAADEINAIARLFQGSGITRLTGDELGPGLLQDQRYSEADLFHFASHGQINFEYPELSRLILAGNSDSGPGAYLTPLQIGRVPLEADLVVLSACETSGVSAFSFDRNLGYVSEFMHAGAGAVVASLWPVSDSFAGEFMQDFYTSLIQGTSASRALALAKRRQITREEPAATLEWASFQIYLR